MAKSNPQTQSQALNRRRLNLCMECFQIWHVGLSSTWR